MLEEKFRTLTLEALTHREGGASTRGPSPSTPGSAAAAEAEAAEAAAAVQRELEARHADESARLRSQHMKEMGTLVGELTGMRQQLREGRQVRSGGLDPRTSGS